ncbi:MAG: efflux RND transporter permease subunit, partial [Myxococcales bacterium]|nr:efflux RND transporter permease subunit [Myxococcales bacterium]
MKRLVDYLIDTPLLAGLLAVLLIAAGLYVAPFNFEDGGLRRDRVPVDALPDLGENQQIVFTRWPGRSPQDVEDQITYPLTVTLLGLPGVKTIRSYSYFGYSTIYVVFGDGAEFYWSRSRVLEKLASLPPGTLPEDTRPELGPDATALGQVFWYTLEGEGFDLHELRTLQDFYVKYALQAVEGVSEVASVGGFVREYQIDVDPDAMRSYGITLAQVYDAVRRANAEVGARTLEVNRVEYVLRGVGFVRSIEDLRQVVVAARDHVPLTLDQIATVSQGPAMRRGALDKSGVEAVGGVVVVRYGANPLEVIDRLHAQIEAIAPGLPTRALPDGRTAQVKIAPFYDRTQLIDETLDTLATALVDEILITLIVVVLMLWELRSSVLVSGLLPLAVLLAFVGMKVTGVDANVMSLAGIAIAIGTMVDMGIIITENITRHLETTPEDSVLTVVKRATGEVASAVLTAVATTVISFLPVFTMTGPEARLFRPLAFTKTYALIASIAVALLVLPTFAALLFRGDARGLTRLRILGSALVGALGVPALIFGWKLAAVALWAFAAWRVVRPRLAPATIARVRAVANVLAVIAVLVALAAHWQPLGAGEAFAAQLAFVALLSLGLLGGFHLFLRAFAPILRWCLAHKLVFAAVPASILAFGLLAWLGAPAFLAETRLGRAFPGIGKEFMPPLDEGSYLWMPTTMPHAGVEEALSVVQLQDRALAALPEVEHVVGKIGRVDSALDPAPISMIETLITYKPEYGPPDPETGERPRLWRPHIHTPQDIWDEIVAAAAVPGTTSAPKLQPIAARIVMLQSGMRAPMGVKIRGQSLADLDVVARAIEAELKQVPGVEPATVLADRVVGKPYLEIHVDREEIARYGIHMRDVQDVIEVAIGGKPISTSVEGRERYAIRVRYPRELRDSPEALREVLVPTAAGPPIPLAQIARLEFTRGPMVIKSEDTFLIGYVTFDKRPGEA